MRVLVVDASPRVRARLGERLRGRSLVVVEAADVTAALAAAASNSPDAILLDVHGEDVGIDGLAKLRQAVPDAFVVALTNEANDVHRRECMRHGADAFLDKSREFDDAVELVVTRLPRP